MRISRLRRMTVGLLLTSLAGTVHEVAANAKDTASTFTVHVRNYAQVDSKTLAGAEKVAAEIFRHAGVEMRAIPALTESSPEKDSESQPLDLCDLWLSIFSGPMSGALGLPDQVMGLAPGSGRDRQTVFVLYDNVEALAQRQLLAMEKRDIVRPATRSQILGHMMAHELGHVLLNLALHSDSGIMRGNWDLKDLQDAAFGSLLFTRPQAAVLREEVTRRARQQELAKKSQETAR
jgi:hypothetical protein